MILLAIIGVVVAVWAWNNLGPIWAILLGFLFVGGAGWQFLYGLFSLFLPDRRGRQQFVEAWETRSGEMRFGRTSTHPPRGLYQQWRKEREETRESAYAWMDRVLGPSAPPPFGYHGQVQAPRGNRSLHPWQSDEFADLRHELRHKEAPWGGLAWGQLERGKIGYHESLAFVLNKHLGWSGLGRQYLTCVAEGSDLDACKEGSVDWLLNDGRDELLALRGEATQKEAEQLVDDGLSMTWFYTGALKGFEHAPQIARLALEDELTPEYLRSLPNHYKPEMIAGFGEIE